MKNSMVCEHGGEIYKLARALLLNPSDLVDFSSSINPLGPPAWVKGALAKAVADIAAYPDNACAGVRNAISRHWNMDSNAVLVGNGSTELIFLAARTLRPRRTVVVGPTFGEYERAARLAGSEVCFAYMDISENFRWIPNEADWDAISRSDLCYLCNPNNPSGTVLEKEILQEILKRCPKTLFVIDEAFVDFVPVPEEVSLLKNMQEHPNLIVLRSFTKFYAIAGLRLGYAIADPALVQAMESCKEPWSVNTSAQAVGERLLADGAFAQRTRAWLPRERGWLLSELGRFQEFACYPSQANYLLLKIRAKGLDARMLFEKLLSYRLVVRDASDFRGLDSSFIRVAVKSRTHNSCLVEALGKVLSKSSPLSKT